MDILIPVVVLVVGVVAGTGIGYILRKTIAAKTQDSAEAKADRIIKDAKSKQQELLLDAKDKAISILDDAKEEESQRRQEISKAQQRVENRENLFDKKLLELESKQEELQEKRTHLEAQAERVKQIKAEQTTKLEEVAGLNKEAALERLEERVAQEYQESLDSRIRKLEEHGSEEMERKAKELMTVVIQRCSTSHAAETTTTTVNIPNDEMKGRIIGKEGRNIKRLEELTGVDIIIDDTPGAIVVSGFSPIRRHLAKRTLDNLLSDGRIHPTKIEAAVERAKKELSIDIKKAGDAALQEVGLTGFDPKLIGILGRLKYRTSYGQNVLRHSIEVAFLASMLAEHLGADPVIAKKGGLLHDIGKSVDHEIKGTHPEIGRDIAQKFGLSEEVIAPILHHHDDHPPTLEAIIVKVADAISGSRPGARKDTFENYVQRLEELEAVALRFDGVQKAYAIQAGREVRIFVHPEQLDDHQAKQVAKQIATSIEEELKYPGEIKVNLIRETRIIEYAR